MSFGARSIFSSKTKILPFKITNFSHRKHVFIAENYQDDVDDELSPVEIRWG